MEENANAITIYIPMDEHIAELKEKGIDIEVELSRVVFDALKARKDGKNGIRKLSICVSKEQMEELEKYGINGPEVCAIEFKEELHRTLMNTKSKKS